MALPARHVTSAPRRMTLRLTEPASVRRLARESKRKGTGRIGSRRIRSGALDLLAGGRPARRLQPRSMTRRFASIQVPRTYVAVDTSALRRGQRRGPPEVE